jgi:hypothetical protein
MKKNEMAANNRTRTKLIPFWSRRFCVRLVGTDHGQVHGKIGFSFLKSHLSHVGTSSTGIARTGSHLVMHARTDCLHLE